jgi:hypothetical protein
MVYIIKKVDRTATVIGLFRVSLLKRGSNLIAAIPSGSQTLVRLADHPDIVMLIYPIAVTRQHGQIRSRRAPGAGRFDLGDGTVRTTAAAAVYGRWDI